MEPSVAEILQGGGVLAFAGTVLWLLKSHLARIEVIQERSAVAQEKQATSFVQLAISIEGVVSTVRDLSGEVRKMRDDLDELTPVESKAAADRSGRPLTTYSLTTREKP